MTETARSKAPYRLLTRLMAANILMKMMFESLFAFAGSLGLLSGMLKDYDIAKKCKPNT